jgi:hypothetical protein
VTAPDFAAILATWELFTAADGEHGIRIREAADLLAAKVPELCTTCGGEALVIADRWHEGAIGEMACPDCPTIGQLLAEAVAARELARTHGVTPAKLLAIGAAVMRAHVDQSEVWFNEDEWTDEACELIAELRAVQP